MARSSCPASSTPTITSSKRRCAASSPTAFSSMTDVRRSEYNYYETILQNFSMQSIGRKTSTSTNCSARIAQLDTGVTTVMDVSQIHHSPEHSDAPIEGAAATPAAAPSSAISRAGATGAKYPQDAQRIKEQYFASDDQLLTMVMGGEIYIPGYEAAWKIGRELGLPIALHVVGTFGMARNVRRTGGGGRVRRGQHLHPHDRHVRHGLADSGRCRSARVAGGADRDADAPRHAADPEMRSISACSPRFPATSNAP